MKNVDETPISNADLRAELNWMLRGITSLNTALLIEDAHDLYHLTNVIEGCLKSCLRKSQAVAIRE